MADGQYKFSIGLDSKQLELDVAQAKKAFDSLVKQAQQAGVKIDNIPNPFENIGKSAPQVAQATQQFNGLNMATQQLVRELPAASMGLNTFFMAISNNLPVFADQVKNLRQQGTSTAGVLKGIGTALFSWQTVLVLGVTALSMYGKEIGAWISSLFKGKEAVDALKDAQNGLNEEIAKNGLGIGKEIGKYESLRREFEAINGDIKEQERFVRDNQSAFDDLGVSVNSVIEAEDFFSGAGTEAFLTALRLRAEALAAQKLAVEQYEKAIIAETNKANAEIELQSISQYTTQNKATSGGAYAPMSYGGSRLINSDYTSKKEEIDNLDAEAKSARSVADAYFDMHDAKMKAASDTLEDANINQNDQQTQAELRAAEKRAKELAELKIKLRKDAEQAEIEAMAEGTNKKIAQIKLDYELRRQEIERQKADLIAKQGKPLTAEQSASFDTLHASNKMQATSELEQYVEEQVEAAGVALRAKEEALKAEKKARAEYLIEYGNYEEKRLAIAEKYAMLIADATNEWDRKGLENERDNALAELDNAMSEKSSLWVRLFDDASKMTKKQIKSIIAETKQLLDYLNGASTTKPLGFTDEQLKVLKEQPEAIKAIYDELMEKQAELDAKTQYPFHNIIKALEKLKEAQKEAKKAVEATTKEAREAALVKSQALKSEAEKNIYTAAGEAAQSVLSLAEAYNKLAEATGDERIKEASAQLGAMAQNFAAAGQGAASGGWIGAIVGGVTDMLTQTIDAIATNKSEQYELLQNTEDFVRKYKLALLSLNDDDYDSIFGVNNIEKMQDAYRKAQEALEAYYASVYKQLDLPEDDKEARSWGGLIFSGFLWLGKRTTELQKELENAFRKGYTALEGMQVKTLDRSGWANFWGAKDEYTSLKTLAPEMWNEDGIFNIEAAEAFLATNTQITEEQRKQIQNVIDLHKQYEDLDAQIEDQLRSIFGDLAGDVTDIIFDAVRNGTDAWDAFGEKGSEIIDKLGRQMIQQVFVQSYFEQYAEDLKAAYASENPQEELARITAKMFDGIGPMLDAASAAAIEWDNNAEAMGYGPSQSNQLTTYAKGFQTMSQETGSELNGRFTDIQGQTHRIADAVEFMKGLQGQHTQHMQSVSNTLASIHNDTSLIAEHTKALARMDANLDAMRRAIDNGAI